MLLIVALKDINEIDRECGKLSFTADVGMNVFSTTIDKLTYCVRFNYTMWQCRNYATSYTIWYIKLIGWS